MKTSPFECPVCLEFFNDKECLPVTFLCGHSCCKAHIAKLTNCPLCKASISSSKKAAPNFALKDGAIEYQKVVKKLQFYEQSFSGSTPSPKTANDTVQSIPHLHNNNPFSQKRSFNLTVTHSLGNFEINRPISFSIGAPPVTRPTTQIRRQFESSSKRTLFHNPFASYTINSSSANVSFTPTNLGESNALPSLNPTASSQNIFETKFPNGVTFNLGKAPSPHRDRKHRSQHQSFCN